MTTLLSIAPSPDAPIICDMRGASDTLAERLREYRRLFEHALIDRESTDSSTTFRFAARPGVADWVRDLATREAACCGFASHEVVTEGDEIVWTTSGGSGASGMALVDSALVDSALVDSALVDSALVDEALVDASLSSDEVARRLAAVGVPVVE